ncbi:MAG: hypothetical protein ACLTBR_03350 [Anaerostipes sp.]|uniref:hypothetical protein n=1 Tax=Anaerostipes sp. TaxID=1872530 RepID=UPI003993B454
MGFFSELDIVLSERSAEREDGRLGCADPTKTEHLDADESSWFIANKAMDIKEYCNDAELYEDLY